MTTGAEFYNFIKNGIDQNYTGYLNSTRANRLIRASEIRIAEKLYSTNKTEKTSDELSPLTLMNQVITVRDNRFYTGPLRITAATFIGSIVSVTTDSDHQLQVGDSLTISDLQGLNINNTYTVLTVPTPNQVTFTQIGVVGVWVQGTGSISTPFMFANILHPLAIETTFTDNELLDIEFVSTANVPYIRFDIRNKVRNNTKIRILNALGVTGLNGDFYCKQRNRTSVYIYTNEALTIPAVLSGTYQGSGQAKIIVSEYSTRMHSDRRIAPSSQADVWAPKYGISNNSIILFPTNSICDSVKVDYMRYPPITIDVLNTTLDLEQYYDFKYLMKIVDEAVVSFMLQVREPEQAQAMNASAQMNP